MSQTGSNICPVCGTAAPAGSRHQVCPACLMAGAMDTDPADPGASTAFLQPDELAEEFPQFDILECLGRGGMGVVYKARQKSLNRLVAIKILAPEREHSARFAGRFVREAEFLAKLSHPHIVTIHDFGQTAGPVGLYYLVMELVNGVSVHDLLREGKLAPRQALAIVPEICDALQFAHNHGVVHRDIKPANILLDPMGHVKVADFGLAKLMGAEPEPPDKAVRAARPPDLSEAGTVIGTPVYMAPEQMEQPDAVDHRADIYAVGVLFYQMLTGELPDKLIKPPSEKVQIDVRLDQVVLRALERNPALRYPRASMLKTEVESIAGSAGSEAIPRQTRSAKPRGRLVVIGLLVAALLLAMLLLLPRAVRHRGEHAWWSAGRWMNNAYQGFSNATGPSEKPAGITWQASECTAPLKLPEGYMVSTDGNGTYQIASSRSSSSTDKIVIDFQSSDVLHPDPFQYLRQMPLKIKGFKATWGIYKTTDNGQSIIRKEVIMPNFLPRQRQGTGADYISVRIDANSQDGIDQLTPVAGDIIRNAAQ